MTGCNKPLQSAEGWFKSGTDTWHSRKEGTRHDTHCGLEETSTAKEGAFCLWLCEECAVRNGVKW